MRVVLKEVRCALKGVSSRGWQCTRFQEGAELKAGRTGQPAKRLTVAQHQLHWAVEDP